MKGPAQGLVKSRCLITVESSSAEWSSREACRIPPHSAVTAWTLPQTLLGTGSQEMNSRCSLGLPEQSHQQPNQEAGTFPSHMYMSYGCRLVAKEVVSLATGKQGLLRQAGETGGTLRQEGGWEGRREGGAER